MKVSSQTDTDTVGDQDDADDNNGNDDESVPKIPSMHREKHTVQTH